MSESKWIDAPTGPGQWWYCPIDWTAKSEPAGLYPHMYRIEDHIHDGLLIWETFSGGCELDLLLPGKWLGPLDAPPPPEVKNEQRRLDDLKMYYDGYHQGDRRDEALEFIAEIERLRSGGLEKDKHEIGELLAVLHRDGGQYQDKVGIAQACKDGLTIYYELRDMIDRLRADDKTLRRLLWFGHGCTGLYGDDGEMQCSSCGIDFKRNPVDRIEEKIQLRGAKALDRIAKLEKLGRRQVRF